MTAVELYPGRHGAGRRRRGPASPSAPHRRRTSTNTGDPCRMRHTSRRGGCLLGGRVVETVCPSCGGVCRTGARFCPSCGASLSRRPPASGRRHRAAHHHHAVLRSGGLHGAVRAGGPRGRRWPAPGPTTRSPREVIQQYGGVVEKFIGDAVVGVFGVPAHEDDAERAVRAAIRLQERIADMPGMDGGRCRPASGSTPGTPSSGWMSTRPPARAFWRATP